MTWIGQCDDRRNLGGEIEFRPPERTSQGVTATPPFRRGGRAPTTTTRMTASMALEGSRRPRRSRDPQRESDRRRTYDVAPVPSHGGASDNDDGVHQ